MAADEGSAVVSSANPIPQPALSQEEREKHPGGQKRFLSLCAFLLLGGAVWGGSFSQSARGTSSATFLKPPVSARSSGLGDAVTALEGDAASLAWNPAGLAGVRGRLALLSRAPYLDGTTDTNGLYSQGLGGGGFGVGVNYFDAGAIDQTEGGSGATVGSFHPADAAVSAGYGRRVCGWAIGLAGKWVTSRVVQSDSTFAADAGVLSPGLWSDRIHLGAAAKNLFGSLQLSDTARPLPVEYSVGAAVRIMPHWMGTADLKFPRDNAPAAALGTEGDWSPQKEWTLFARAGWNGTTDGGLGGLAGSSVGVGIMYSKLTVDYAFSPAGDLGNAQNISLTFSF